MLALSAAPKEAPAGFEPAIADLQSAAKVRILWGKRGFWIKRSAAISAIGIPLAITATGTGGQPQRWGEYFIFISGRNPTFYCQCSTDTIVVSQGEINSFVNLTLAEQIPPEVSDLELQLEQDQLAARAVVDLDLLRAKLPAEGPAAMLSMLSGTVPVEIEGPEVLHADDHPDLLEKVAMPDYKATIERIFIFKAHAFDWNCPQHISQKYTTEEIKAGIAKLEPELLKPCCPEEIEK